MCHSPRPLRCDPQLRNVAGAWDGWCWTNPPGEKYLTVSCFVCWIGHKHWTNTWKTTSNSSEITFSSTMPGSFEFLHLKASMIPQFLLRIQFSLNSPKLGFQAERHQNLLIRLLDFQHLLWVGIRSLLSDPTSPQAVQGLPGVSAELGPGILGPRWIWEIWQLSTPSCRQVLLWFRICHFLGARKSEQLKGWDSLSHFDN